MKTTLISFLLLFSFEAFSDLSNFPSNAVSCVFNIDSSHSAVNYSCDGNTTQSYIIQENINFGAHAYEISRIIKSLRDMNMKLVGVTNSRATHTLFFTR